MWDEQKSKVVHKGKRSKLELLRGNLPRACQASCLRSLHLQMVACQVIIIKSFATSFCGILDCMDKMTWYRAFLLKESETGSSLNALHRSPDHSSIRIRHVLMFSFGIIVRVLYLNLQRLFGPLHSPSSLFMTLMISMLIMNDSSSLSFSASLSRPPQRRNGLGLPPSGTREHRGGCQHLTILILMRMLSMICMWTCSLKVDAYQECERKKNRPSREARPSGGLGGTVASEAKLASERIEHQAAAHFASLLKLLLLTAHLWAAQVREGEQHWAPACLLLAQCSLRSSRCCSVSMPASATQRSEATPLKCSSSPPFTEHRQYPPHWLWMYLSIFSKSQPANFMSYFFKKKNSISSPIPLSFLLIIFQIQKVSRRWPGWRLNPTDQLYTTSFAQRLKLCSGAFSSTAWNWKHWICFTVYSWLGIS